MLVGGQRHRAGSKEGLFQRDEDTRGENVRLGTERREDSIRIKWREEEKHRSMNNGAMEKKERKDDNHNRNIYSPTIIPENFGTEGKHHSDFNNFGIYGLHMTIRIGICVAQDI